MLLNGVSKTGAAKRRVENRHSRRKGRSPSQTGSQHVRSTCKRMRPRPSPTRTRRPTATNVVQRGSDGMHWTTAWKRGSAYAVATRGTS